jgi:hypothetical protein
MISSSRTDFSYGGRITFYLQISPKIYRLSKENIALYSREILETKIDSSEYTLTDLGDGRYSISFDAPKEKGANSYFLRLFKGNLFFAESNELQFNIDDPRLYFQYVPSSSGMFGETSGGISTVSSGSDSFIRQVSSFGNIVYSKMDRANMTFGLASQKNDVLTDNENFLISVPYDEQVFFFTTKSSFDPSKREDLLFYGGFMNNNNPSFGFLLSDEYDYKTILGLDDVVLTSDFPIEKGKKSLIVINKGLDSNGRKIVYISADKLQAENLADANTTGRTGGSE